MNNPEERAVVLLGWGVGRAGRTDWMSERFQRKEGRKEKQRGSVSGGRLVDQTPDSAARPSNLSGGRPSRGRPAGPRRQPPPQTHTTQVRERERKSR